eukprot:ANDGO_05746.mRNA.1 Golgi SNAP receptor complex member 1-2
MLSSSAAKWEELGREARALERDIDSKLVAYSKLGSSSRAFPLDEESGSHGSSADTEPLLDEQTRKTKSIESELEDLLDRLSTVNSSMQSLVSASSNSSSSQSSGSSSSSSQSIGPQSPGLPVASSSVYGHTLQRHREILHEYTQEFRKYRATITASREHAKLLSSVRRDMSNQKAGSMRPMDSLLRERNAAHDADRVLSESLSAAQAVRSDLSSQRDAFDRIGGRVSDMRSRFPTVDQLVARISKKKRRDMIILGSVIAACLIFTIVYVMRR